MTPRDRQALATDARPSTEVYLSEMDAARFLRTLLDQAGLPMSDADAWHDYAAAGAVSHPDRTPDTAHRPGSAATY